MFTGAPRPARRPTLFNFLLQWGLRKSKDYQDVPLLSELATSAEQKVIFDFVCQVASLARPVATNADVPAERVAALRRAFDATMQDPEFLADAARQGMEISPMAGEALQSLVTAIVNASPAVVEKVRRAVR